jgi:succinoglycan biosynthesis transport protein ExoP
MEPEGYFRTFGKRWFAIFLCTLLGLALSAGVSKAITPVYAANATLFLKVESAGASLFEKSQFGLARIQSYPELVNSPELLSNVISTLHLPMSQQELGSALSATNPTSTVLLQVTAESTNPKTAANIANTAANELSSLVNKLENTSSANSSSSVRLNLTLPAEAPTTPSSPKIAIILGLGLLVGLAFGLFTALLLARFDTRIKTPADVRRYSGLPVIGQLPPRLSREWMFADGQGPDAVIASLDETAANIRAIFGGDFPALLVLVPIGRGPSKAGTRVGLARSLALTGRRVVLVETDTAAQNVSGLVIQDEAVGLSDVLSGVSNIASSVLKRESQPFEILPAGKPLGSRASFAAERHSQTVLGTVANRFDVAVIQVSQGGTPIDLDIIAPALSSAILIATFARTNSHKLNGQISRLRALGIEPVGVILTDVPQWRKTQLLESWEPTDIVDVVDDREPHDGAGELAGDSIESSRLMELQQVIPHRPVIAAPGAKSSHVQAPSPVPAVSRSTKPTELAEHRAAETEHAQETESVE